MSGFIRRWLASRRLAKTLKPDPAYMQRRLAHLPPERRAKQLAVSQMLREGVGG